MKMKLELEVNRTFELEKSVCNHGFFMMAPNRWIPSQKVLMRPLRLPDGSDVTVSISQSLPTSLSITVFDRQISPSDHQSITDQVKRMLRLSKEDDERVKEFHTLHADAAERGFGHLFRNPSLFEDIVKSLLLCGCNFRRSLDMAKGLCILQKEQLKRKATSKKKRGKKRKSSSSSSSTSCPHNEPWGNFPSAQELASLKDGEGLLREKFSLGYRAPQVMRLANAVVNGEIVFSDLEKLCDGDKLYRKLSTMHGFRDFATSNVLMCMGFYHKIPIDSETVRHIKQIHQKQDCTEKNVKAMATEIYDKYAPYQTLAYWMELVEYYENNLGKLSLLENHHYKNVAGSIINRATKKQNIT